MSNASILDRVKNANQANPAAATAGFNFGGSAAPAPVAAPVTTVVSTPFAAPASNQNQAVVVSGKPKFVVPTAASIGKVKELVTMGGLTSPILCFATPQAKTLYPLIVEGLGKVPTEGLPVIVYPADENDKTKVVVCDPLNFVVLDYVQFWGKFDNEGSYVDFVYDPNDQRRRDMSTVISAVVMVFAGQEIYLARIEFRRARCKAIEQLVGFMGKNGINSTLGVMVKYTEAKTAGSVNNYMESKADCQKMDGLEEYVRQAVTAKGVEFDQLAGDMYARLPGK